MYGICRCIVVEARGHWVYSSITLPMPLNRQGLSLTRKTMVLARLPGFLCVPGISTWFFMLAQHLLFPAEPSLQTMKKFWKTVWPHVSLSWFSNIVRNPTMLLSPIQFGSLLFVKLLLSLQSCVSNDNIASYYSFTEVLSYHSLLCLASVGWLDFKVYLINKITDL